MLIGVLVSALRFDAIQHNTVLVFSLLTPNPTQTQRLVSPSWNSNIKPYSHTATPTKTTNIHPKITASTATSIFTWCGVSLPPLAFVLRFEFGLELWGFFSLRGRRVRMSEGSMLRACE
jgi:hypothetical protein